MFLNIIGDVTSYTNSAVQPGAQYYYLGGIKRNRGQWGYSRPFKVLMYMAKYELV